MGFLYHAITIPSIITFSFLFNLFNRACLLLITALTRLGLYKPPPEDDHPNSTDNSNNYVLILDGSSPSLVPIPVHVVTAAIKTRVPILPYGDVVLRRRRRREEDGDEVCEENMCCICLELVEWGHEVRELCGCAHVFHRGCLDTWIDEGQITCPLCRSMLLPPKTNLTRCNQSRDSASLVAS